MSRPSPAEVLRRRTAERAYFRWLNGHGDTISNWLLAEDRERADQDKRRKAAHLREYEYNKGH